MDALNGYGSSSSSDDDDDTAKPEEKQNRRAYAFSERTTRMNKNPKTSTDAVATTTSFSTKPPDARRGKKILSLASVLPQHILERWTNTEDDSDDEEEQPSRRSTTQQNEDSTPVAAAAPPPRKNPKSTEIAALLRDLQRVAPVGGATQQRSNRSQQKGQHAAAPESTSSGDRMGDSNKKDNKHAETLGSAFVTSVVVTTDKASTTNDAVVRDIHGEEPPYDPHNKNHHVALDDKYTADEPPQASQQSFFGVEPDNRPRKSAPRIINAAPRILQQGTSSTTSTGTGGMPPPLHQPPPHHPTEDSIAGPPSKTHTKRSRQEMERALRQGRVAQVVGEQSWRISHHVESVDPTAYTPPVPAFAATPATTLRNVPIPRYDPALGNTTTTTTNTHGGRNNPIHQLLSQAVQLEQQRLQQSSTGTGTTNVKLHRANAKRKYGW